MTDRNKPATPTGLREASRRFYRRIVADYELEAHHARLLEAACRAWDVAEDARATVRREGAYYVDRFGQPKVHPAVDVERQARGEFRGHMRELALDTAPPAEVRPPRLGANAHLRIAG